MKPAGLLLVTRRYWPMPGGWEKVWTRLLGELARRGRTATVLTPRQQTDWPAETIHNGVRIVRLPPPTRGGWGEYRYLARITKAIGELRSEFDVIAAGGLRGDAYAAITAARRMRRPVVLQTEQPGLNGDCRWQIEATCGSRIKRRCYLADAYLAATPLLERELIAAGYARSRIRTIPLGAPLPIVGDAAAKLEARRALAQADPALALGDGDKLVACVGRLRVGKGLDLLLEAWRKTVIAVPRATLWLVGEGPDADYLRERTRELDLTSSVRLTGAFDDVDDVYRSADAAVFPALEDGPAVGLLEAMSYGLPIAAADVVTHRDRLTDGVDGIVYERRNVDALAAALTRILTDDAATRSLGASARRRTANDFSFERMVDSYEALLDELTNKAVARAAG